MAKNTAVKSLNAATAALIGGNGSQSNSVCFARLSVDMLENVIAHPLAVYRGQNGSRWITVECYLNEQGVGGLRLVQSAELRTELEASQGRIPSMGVCRRTLKD